MRRHTKPRVVWLPPTNHASVDAAGTSGIQAMVVETAADPGFAVGEIPLTIDSQDDPLDPNTSLSDIENSGYRLRRIVGKIWLTMDQTAGANVAVVIATAGIIVRRSDPATGVSYALSTGNASLLAPNKIVNYGDPWVWRRSWLLANDQVVSPPNLPTDNLFFSALDGPHVDVKTARIIGPEERLFLDVNLQVTSATDLGGQTADGVVRILTDLRCLASLRTSSGNRRNASR